MLLWATLLRTFFSVRSERMLMEQIDDNLLFRWFVGLERDAAIWHPTVFTHNRDRLREADVARALLSGLMALKPVRRLLSSDHVSVDGMLIEAWASLKSFRPKDGSGEPPGPGRNGERDFHKETRSNETHASTTDPDARLHRKSAGQESRLRFMGHALLENRNGRVVDATLTHATGTAEREATLTRLDRRKSRHRITLGRTRRTMSRPSVAYHLQPDPADLGRLRTRAARSNHRQGQQAAGLGRIARPLGKAAQPLGIEIRSQRHRSSHRRFRTTEGNHDWVADATSRESRSARLGMEWAFCESCETMPGRPVVGVFPFVHRDRGPIRMRDDIVDYLQGFARDEPDRISSSLACHVADLTGGCLTAFGIL